jgi:hypothetical protein
MTPAISFDPLTQDWLAEVILADGTAKFVGYYASRGMAEAKAQRYIHDQQAV